MDNSKVLSCNTNIISNQPEEPTNTTIQVIYVSSFTSVLPWLLAPTLPWEYVVVIHTRLAKDTSRKKPLISYIRKKQPKTQKPSATESNLATRLSFSRYLLEVLNLWTFYFLLYKMDSTKSEPSFKRIVCNAHNLQSEIHALDSLIAITYDWKGGMGRMVSYPRPRASKSWLIHLQNGTW